MADPSKVEFKYPAIPVPTQDPASLQATLKAVKATVEKLTGQTRGTESIDQRVFDLKSVTALGDRTLTARITQVDEVHTDAESALASRITTLDAELTQADETIRARITEVDQASVNRDGALAESIDTVEAQYGDISAQGQIAFRASAGPSGYYASYDLTLVAGAAKAGLSVLARQEPDGSYSSAIVLSANQFRLMDPMLGPTPVFNYGGGVFSFNVPVRLYGNQLDDRSITNAQFGLDGNQSSQGLDVTITTRPGAQVQCVAEASGQPELGAPLQPGPKPQLYLTRRLLGQDVGTQVQLRAKPMSFFIVRFDSGNQIFYTSTPMLFVDTPPTAGTWVYRLYNANSLGPFSMIVTELYR